MVTPVAPALNVTRVRILGVPMDCVTMGQAILIADDMVREHRPGGIFAINPEKIVTAGTDPGLLKALDGASLLIPDGVGAVVAARLGGARNLRRVSGADLMPELCALAALRGYPVFVYGGRPEVTPRAVKALRETYPRLIVAGYQHGYLTQKELEALPDRINESGARILFAGLGSPQQELWVQATLPRLTTVAICQGVGGTIDVLAGRVKRAPLAWRRAYLEWLYRLLSDPTRVRRFPRLLNFVWRVWREGVVLGEPRRI